MAAYPRKQTFFIFVICALVTGGTAFYVYGENGPETAGISAGNTAAAVQATGTISTNADWKKEFLDTASTSAYKTSSAKPASVEKQAPLTATDLLSRNFLTKYGELHQAGLTGDQATVDNVMGQIVSDNTATLQAPKTYTAKDPPASQGNPTASAYKNAIQAVSAAYDAHQDEAEIAAQAFETADMTKLAEIDPIIVQYKNMISLLLKTPVPQAYIQFHLDLLNAMSEGLFSAQAFRHMDTDALNGFAAVRMNAESFAMIHAAISNIHEK